MREQLYQSERPWVVDSSRFEQTFGWRATPLPEAIRATVDWFRGARAGHGELKDCAVRYGAGASGGRRSQNEQPYQKNGVAIIPVARGHGGAGGGGGEGPEGQGKGSGSEFGMSDACPRAEVMNEAPTFNGRQLPPSG